MNREVTKLQSPAGVHVTEKEGPGVVWITGSDFVDGTIEVNVRGRDVLQRSFLGVAFHGKDDNTYEAVYLRPFNFRATDPARHQHAVQYMASPDYDWPRLRQEFPEEFENPVDASVSPTDWVPLRVVVKGKTIQIFVGASPVSRARSPQARHARTRNDRAVGGQQQRRRFRRPSRHRVEVSGLRSPRAASAPDRRAPRGGRAARRRSPRRR